MRGTQQHLQRQSTFSQRQNVQLNQSPWRVKRTHQQHICRAVQTVDTLAGLVAWARDKGVSVDKVSITQSIADDAPIMVAAKDIPVGDAIISIPQANWLTPEAAVKALPSAAVAELEPWLQVALFLLHERSKGSSPHKAYIDALPQRLNTPLFWSEEELSMLQGTQLLQSVLAYKQFFVEQFQVLEQQVFSTDRATFPAQVFTQEALTWAAATVRSRLHLPLDGQQLALVPLADSVPHRREATASWTLKAAGPFGVGGQQLQVTANRPIRQGEAISMDYGPERLDGAVLLDYGVIDTSSPRPGYSLSLSIAEDDRYADDKVDILERNGLATTISFVLRKGQEPGEEMLGFLRLMQLSDMDCFLLESIFEDQVWGFMLEPVSKTNEAAVCAAVVEGARAALAGYPTTIEQDLALLRSKEVAPGSRQELAVKVRLGEKEALDSALAWFEDRAADLDELVYYQERRLRRLGLIDEDGRTTYDSFFKDGIA